MRVGAMRRMIPAVAWMFGAAAAWSRAEDLSKSHIRPVKVERIRARPKVRPQEGLYGEIRSRPGTDFRPYLKRPQDADAWKAKKFSYVVTELSPAVLYSSRYPEISFFNRIEAWGRGGPTHFAVPTRSGVRVASRGRGLDGKAQSEPWVLAWFAGAEGWLFDVPWLIVLEHRARTISLGAEGLKFRFGGPCGRVLAMPLYGYYKCPPAGTKWSRRLGGAVDFGIDTSRWARSFPRAVAARCRWWSEVLRRYPIHCKETFKVDRLHDVLTVKSQFEYLDIKDDWRTRPRTFAPISPSLALALTDEHNTFPVRFSDPVTDPFIMTAHGPYMGVEGKDSYEIEFETLKYIHELERPELPPAEAPGLVKEAYKRLQETASRRWAKPPGAEIRVDHGKGNYCWAAMGDRWYPRALPYVEDRNIQANAKATLKQYYHDWVIRKERYTEYKGPKKPYRNIYLFHGPGIGSWGGLGDAGKFAENLYVNLWSYAHYTEDVEVMKERWDFIKQLDITPLECGWKGVGRGSIAEMGDEAPPPIQYARLAWMAGDIDTYYYQCYIATRELLHHFIKQNGAQYFRRLQPYHQYYLQRVPRDFIEPMPENVFISNLWGGLFGWQVDGPTYPKQHRERQYWNRWVRFACCSTARFYRDHIRPEDLRKEFKDWKARFDGKPKPGGACQWIRDDPHIMPSLVRIMSLTLNAPLDEIEKLAVFDGKRLPYNRWRLYPDSGVFASAISIIRLSHPLHHDRLVPRSGRAGPYLLGLERSIQSDWSILLQQLANYDKKAKKLHWPVVGWTRWQTPKQPKDLGGGDLFGFGVVRPGPARSPTESGGWTQINWNTYTTWIDE